MSRLTVGSIVVILIFLGSILSNMETVTAARKNYNDFNNKGSFADLSYFPYGHNFNDKYEGIVDNTTFEIWNSGCCGLTYLLIEECDWVSVDPDYGHSYGEHDVITVTINTTGLQIGFHECEILIDSSDIDGIFTVYVNIITPPNKPPSKPKIVGPFKGKYGEEYTFTATSNDSYYDQIWFKWDWGDDNISKWIGPYNSEEECTCSHTWQKEGYFNVKVKAKDLSQDESDWSDPHRVSMPKNKHIINHLSYFIKWILNFTILFNNY
jgi:hypothetical protein